MFSSPCSQFINQVQLKTAGQLTLLRNYHNLQYLHYSVLYQTFREYTISTVCSALNQFINNSYLFVNAMRKNHFSEKHSLVTLFSSCLSNYMYLNERPAKRIFASYFFVRIICQSLSSNYVATPKTQVEVQALRDTKWPGVEFNHCDMLSLRRKSIPLQD